MSEYKDKTIECVDCGNEFAFTARDQEFYAEKGFTNEPKRCRDCRNKKKADRQGNRRPDGQFNTNRDNQFNTNRVTETENNEEGDN